MNNINASNLTTQDIFELGMADISFGMDEGDQALHILLPAVMYAGTEYEQRIHEVFESLFENYFDKIPKHDDLNNPQKEYIRSMAEQEGGNDCYWLLYRGALRAWCRDIGLGIERPDNGWSDWVVQSFRDLVGLNQFTKTNLSLTKTSAQLLYNQLNIVIADFWEVNDRTDEGDQNAYAEFVAMRKALEPYVITLDEVKRRLDQYKKSLDSDSGSADLN